MFIKTILKKHGDKYVMPPASPVSALFPESFQPDVFWQVF
jgi:hypothetical protein